MRKRKIIPTDTFDEKDFHKRSFSRAFNERDNYMTPSILVECILPYIESWSKYFKAANQRDPIIWCPFDKEESRYVQILKDEGYEVVFSHIDDGKDFFKYQPDNFDIIISNPPFSTKKMIFERCALELKKPFVLLMNMMAINYQEISNLFFKLGTDIQFIIPDKKVSFDGHTSSFCSGYVCYQFMKRTYFVHLEHNNSNSNFRR